MVLSKEICIAAQYGKFDELNEYIAAGGDLNDRSSGPWDHRHAPLLYYATCGDRADVVRLLLTHGADPDIREGGGLTPLHRAVFRGFYDVAVLLLDAGADVDARSTKKPEDDMQLFDRTPLTQAATNGQVDVVRLLLRRGASFDLCDCNGRTAEHLARLYYWNNPNAELDDEVD